MGWLAGGWEEPEDGDGRRSSYMATFMTIEVGLRKSRIVCETSADQADRAVCTLHAKAFWHLRRFHGTCARWNSRLTLPSSELDEQINMVSPSCDAAMLTPIM